MRSYLQYHLHSSLPNLRRHIGVSNKAMTAVQAHSLHNLGPVHPPKVEKRAIKPSLARHVTIRVQDPLDHDAPAILHEPRSYSSSEAKEAAVVLVSGAGGGVSGPAGIYPSLADKLSLLLGIVCHSAYCTGQNRAKDPKKTALHSIRLQEASEDGVLFRRHQSVIHVPKGALQFIGLRPRRLVLRWESLLHRCGAGARARPRRGYRR